MIAKLSLALAIGLLLSGCSSEPEQQATSANVHQRIGMSNAAAENCALAGGTLALSSQLDGSSVGMCQLPDGKRCGESALMRGACPAN
ncbi:DUF333 domain-containing protein [Hafnia alvei]|uniref:Putative hemolysin n=1 Tax=Hafnia alvei TaxID=569 RepID=A0A1C6Z6L2_HAFAL|nr:DUF333 domain-containing protein [Hafnia alvei]NLS55835.1 DUF333 domain-containing protein [Hafnia alvei]SCM54763.1 Putative hemolysin [Hafnia alvei]